MKNWKDNVSVILVEPREPGNIGASARALKNMGFSRMGLVNPATMTEETKWFAHNALDIVESASIHNDLTDALMGKAVVAGTTRRKGRKRGIIYPLESGLQKLREIASANEVAILFGREDRGLFNEEVDECGFLLSIPVSDQQPSLNLAQAVLLVAYELSRAEYRGTENNDRAVLVPHEQLAILYDRISGVLKMLEYIPTGNRDIEKKMMNNLKHFIGRAGLTEWEFKMLHGICSRIEIKLVNPTKAAAAAADD